MKRAVFVLASVLALSSCGMSSRLPYDDTNLYNWEGKSGEVTTYEKLSYKDYKAHTPEAVCNLVCIYERIVTNASGVRKMPPPGICAEYGYLLLLPDTASIFAEKASAAQKKTFGEVDYTSVFCQRGKEMLQREIELYPESKPYVEPLLNKLSK